MIARGVQGKPDKAKQKEAEKEVLGDVEGDITWANGVISELDLQPADGEDSEMVAALERVLALPAGRFVR